MTREEAIERAVCLKAWCKRMGMVEDVDALSIILSALRAQQNEQWVPVTERRPDGECLAISMLPGPAYKEMLVGWIAKAEDSETGYVCEGDGVMLPNVTHWKQPEPPEEAT